MGSRILTAVDLSESSAGTLAYAYHLAVGLNAQIDAVYVHEGPVTGRAAGHPSARGLVDAITHRELDAAERELGRLMSGVPDGRRGESLVRRGNAVDLICREADPDKYELLVVATQGRTGFTHMLIGSVAERVVRHARIPVLVVR